MQKLSNKLFSANKKNLNKSLPTRSFCEKASFHDIYVKELNRLNKAAQTVTSNEFKVKENNTPTEAYKHPYHSQKFPVYWCMNNATNDAYSLMGKEPVSAHYESFTLSRKAPIIGAAMLLFNEFNNTMHLSSYYGKHMIYEIYTMWILAIGYLEARYITQRIPAPRLTWYYESFYHHEMKQLYLNWHESLEENSRTFLAPTKEQIDYYLVHKEFQYVKKRLLNSYLENQKASLNKHFYDRTVSMLENIQLLENNNIKNKVKDLTLTSLNNVLDKVNDSTQNQDIIESSFESALDGLKTGLMEYNNDKVLPMFVEELKKNTAEFTNLTTEEENKLFSLSADQKRYVADQDNSFKRSYLSAEPDVTSGVKNNEQFKSIVQRMKGRLNH